MSFGEKLTKLMRLRKISAEHLANDINITPETVVKWQQETDMPYLDQIQNLCIRFSASREYFLNDEIDSTNVNNLYVNRYKVFLKMTILVSAVPLIVLGGIAMAWFLFYQFSWYSGQQTGSAFSLLTLHIFGMMRDMACILLAVGIVVFVTGVKIKTNYKGQVPKFSEKLKYMAANCPYSLQYIADGINTDYEYIDSLMAGSSVPRADDIAALSSLFSVSCDYFITYPGIKPVEHTQPQIKTDYILYCTAVVVCAVSSLVLLQDIVGTVISQYSVTRIIFSAATAVLAALIAARLYKKQK